MLGWFRQKRERLGPHWSGDISCAQMADLIQRFLEDKPTHGQEWNDFVDTPQHDWRMDAYRRCCYELDPLVNSPGQQDQVALAVLRILVASLRKAEKDAGS